jgi:hypothetical protein
LRKGRQSARLTHEIGATLSDRKSQTMKYSNDYNGLKKTQSAGLRRKFVRRVALNPAPRR